MTKQLFATMMNDFTHSIIRTIISKNRIDADPDIIVKQFYNNYIPTNTNKKTNTNISPFTKHFFDQFIQKIKPNLPITYSNTNATSSAKETTSSANETTSYANDTNQLQPLPVQPLTLDRGFKGARPLKGRPSKPKIITIDTTNTHYNNHEHDDHEHISPNRYSKHYAHLLSTNDELFEEPFDHEFDDKTLRVQTRSKRTFNYNGIPLLIDNSNLLYKQNSPDTPFALFNYSLHKIIPISISTF